MGLIIDFSNRICLSSGKLKNFTNYLNDKDEYVKSITHILSKIVPEISEKSFNELKNNKRYHTHMLNNEKVK